MALALALLIAGTLGCGRVDSLEACDILKAECQEDAYYAVVRMRGDGFDPFGGVPPIRTISLEEYRASLEDDEPEAPEPEEPDDEEPEEPADTRSPRSRAFDTALSMLGLLSPTTTSSQAAVDDAGGNVVAYYSGSTGAVTVIDRGGERRFERECSTLVHELIHAFQSREPPIGYTDGTVDDTFARRGLIEGEAELYEQLSISEMRDVAPVKLKWDEFYEDWLAGSRRRLGNARQPYFSVSRGFAYPLGGHRLVGAWLEGGNALVRSLFDDRPRTSHFFMSLGTGVERREAVPTSCPSDPPNGDMQSLILDRFGAAQLYAFLTVQLEDDPLAWEQALGWRGDALRIYGDEDAEQVALSWRVLLDDADKASLLEDVLEQAQQEATAEAEMAEDEGDDDPPLKLGIYKATAEGEYLVIQAATEAELLDGWRDGFGCN